VLQAIVDEGLTPAQAAEQTGVPLHVVERIDRRRRAVAWKQEVPYSPAERARRPSPA
jgi:hypothetical protein